MGKREGRREGGKESGRERERERDNTGFAELRTYNMKYHCQRENGNTRYCMPPTYHCPLQCACRQLSCCS